MIQKKNNGNLFIISAPSGAGKNTLIRALLPHETNLEYSISVTSRKPRQKEINGVHYHFISRKEFENLIEQGEFLEWALVHENYYGTLKSEINRITIMEGKDAILDIDVQGALKLKERIQDAFYIFILPPTLQDLRSRLERRRTEDKAEVDLRMHNSINEINHIHYFDYYLINDQIQIAINDLRSIIKACRLRVSNIQLDLTK